MKGACDRKPKHDAMGALIQLLKLALLLALCAGQSVIDVPSASTKAIRVALLSDPHLTGPCISISGALP